MSSRLPFIRSFSMFSCAIFYFVLFIIFVLCFCLCLSSVGVSVKNARITVHVLLSLSLARSSDHISFSRLCVCVCERLTDLFYLYSSRLIIARITTKKYKESRHFTVGSGWIGKPLVDLDSRFYKDIRAADDWGPIGDVNCFDWVGKIVCDESTIAGTMYPVSYVGNWFFIFLFDTYIFESQVANNNNESFRNFCRCTEPFIMGHFDQFGTTMYHLRQMANLIWLSFHWTSLS